MPYSRITERLGLPAAALTNIATATASAAVTFATRASSNVIDTWSPGLQRILVRAAFTPIGTAATGVATVAVRHGSATNAMSAASVGTGTVAMQATVSIPSTGIIQDIEINGPDLIGKNRYLDAIVTPGGIFQGSVSLQVITEARQAVPNTAANVSQWATPVVVANL